ncbi:hypothetical protein DF3PA_250023 [Candidatus Defluviicoccus seviourii]|uniref:Uncharacterized protein n=1 Tax=Candidatus Defluviicoccus seviourii TaxID=2565273 RepID=A0A564WDR7_9PROT|nr:hypothetical protein DF3PA_250023 [Candidatus Defluviicoccus seviourii]
MVVAASFNEAAALLPREGREAPTTCICFPSFNEAAALLPREGRCTFHRRRRRNELQ